jgi:hypothetical protein
MPDAIYTTDEASAQLVVALDAHGRWRAALHDEDAPHILVQALEDEMHEHARAFLALASQDLRFMARTTC